MKHLSYLAALAAFAAFAPLTLAQTVKPAAPDLRVVELFTSQGCSSCPPSNALITDWAQEDGVLALTYSVDYWDYLGWRDSFADPKFTARQRAYAKAIGHGRVYTPQIVINGSVDQARFATREVMKKSLPTSRPAITRGTDGKISIAASDAAEPAQVSIVRYTPGTQQVDVKRGENGGRTLPLTNVVTDIIDGGVYSGVPLTLDVPQDGAFAVIIQGEGNGPIKAAANFTP